MKKLLLLIFTALSIFTLFSCQEAEEPIDLFSETLIQFSGEDTMSHVTDDFTVILESSILLDTEILWSSNLHSVIIFDGNQGLVTRPDEDTEVVITASAIVDYKQYTTSFTLTVIAEEMIQENFYVSFNSNGGNYTPSALLAGVTGLIAEPAEPTKEGYTFDGWYQNSALSIIWNFSTDQVTSSMTLYAKWVLIVIDDLEFTVTYQSNGGNYTPEDQIVIENGYANQPVDPTKEGYTFDGWYQDISLISVWDFTTDQVTSSMTLYAKWILIVIDDLEFTVTYQSNGGDYTPEDQVVIENGFANQPVDPTQENYIFSGWYLDQTLTSLFDFELLPITEDITLYAKWVEVIEGGGEVEEGIVYVETFTTLTASSSSYTAFSYTGINQILWNAAGARGDQPLDGKAILLAGKMDNSKLSATIDGGIENLTFDVLRGFTNINERKVEVLINSVSYGIFNIDPESAVKQTFTIPDIDITGEFLLEFVHTTGVEARAQILLDNITWTSYSGVSVPVDLQKITEDHASLLIKTSFLESESIVLPSSGAYQSTITWTYQNTSNINNSLINLVTKAVTVPASGQVSVSLTATLSLGTYTLTKEFTVLIGEGEPLTLSQARIQPNNSIIKTTGVITSFYETTTGIYFFIQDNQAGIMVFSPKSYLPQIAVGNEIIIRGTKTSNQGQILLTSITMLDVTGTEVITIDQVSDPLDLDLYESQLIEISGLLMENYSAGTTSFSLMNLNGLIELQIPSDLSSSVILAIQNKLAGQTAGLNVTITANVFRINSAYKLFLIGVESVEVSTSLEASLIETILLSHLNFNLPTEVTSNLDLVDSNDVFFDGIIIWTSSNPSAISGSGIVTQTDAPVSVRMSYQIQISNDIIITGYFDVVVPARSSYSGYYASLSGLTGTALKAELTRIITAGMKTIGYSSTSYVLDETDADPSRPGNILLIYNRASVSGVWDGANTWNKEHVWPQSKLGTASVSDINNLRPSNPSINSNRGNLPFVQGTGTYGARTGGWFPGEADKGDVARIIFYMNTRWGLAISTSVIGSLEMFKQWHEQDPVDAFEMNRNQQIYINQNNRNPYIDHPELVEEVYGPVVLSYENSSDYFELNTGFVTEIIMIPTEVILSTIQRKEWF